MAEGKIAIFGGTFNPVHTEHINIVKAAIKELNLDKLIVMPTFISPHKSIASASAEDRYNMLRLAFDGIEKATVSDYEIKNGGKSYSYLTVEHFKKTTCGELYFICGGDMLVDFKTWKYPERIVDACTLAVFDREDCYIDYEKEKKYFNDVFNKDFIKLSYQGKKDSSTKIRTYVSLGLDISELTDKKVAEYILQKGLYAGDKYDEYVKNNLSQKRLKHTAGVVTAALSKAKELSLDSEKVRISATLHDCAKNIDYRSVKGFSIEKDVPQPVVHAFCGAYIAKNILKIDDEEIINAIRYHTSGRANMTTLEKLIFVADMIEEGRDYEGVDKLRKLFEMNFEECFKECLKEEMIHLINKKTPPNEIYNQTIKAYKYYIEGNN